jgi:ParB family chromosome partitioning protein
MVPIDEIIVGDRYRTDLGDIDALARSIELLGLLHPPVILSDRRLVAGWRRQEALKRLGRSAIPVNVVSNLDDALLLLEAERDENTCRKDFSKTEAVALGMAIEAIEREQAKLRQRHHGGTAPGRTKNTSGNLPEVSAGTTRDKAAEVVGMSPRTYDKAKQVVEAAEKEPEKFGDLPAAMNQFDKVDPAFQELKRRQGSEVPAASKGDSKSAKLDVPSCESDETTGAVGNATDGIANNAVTLKLSSTPAAMARALVKALGQKKALQLVQALERAISTQKGGQPRQRPRNSKTKVKKRTGQKRKLDRLPMTKPRRPVQVVDPMYFG